MNNDLQSFSIYTAKQTATKKKKRKKKSTSSWPTSIFSIQFRLQNKFHVLKLSQIKSLWFARFIVFILKEASHNFILFYSRTHQINEDHQPREKLFSIQKCSLPLRVKSITGVKRSWHKICPVSNSSSHTLTFNLKQTEALSDACA